MGTITKSKTFSAGATIVASEHNTNFDEIISEFNGNIVNVNVHANAAIAASKLNLSTIAQAIEFDGNTTFAGTTIADLGTVTTADINGGTIDGVTIGGAAAPTVTDLGSVTTCDINGGTMDGVQIGGTTATGELIVNNASDNADGLGSQGTAGQVFTSAGTGANPTWVSPALTLISTTSVTTSNSGDITIAASKLYKIIITINAISADDTIGLRFDSDSGNDYQYFRHGLHTPGTNTAIDSGATNASSIVLGGVDTADANSNWFTAELLLDTNEDNYIRARIIGQVLCSRTDAARELVQVGGTYQDATGMTSFEIFTASANMTGKVYLYEYALS